MNPFRAIVLKGFLQYRSICTTRFRCLPTERACILSLMIHYEIRRQLVDPSANLLADGVPRPEQAVAEQSSYLIYLSLFICPSLAPAALSFDNLSKPGHANSLHTLPSKYVFLLNQLLLG